ncbi:MAG: outer membrane protein assembly factor BamE [Betaproteobacteria bacterium]|nr:outer membrane protein assembly factor BamE [Betaproteobacteria bacterium]
MFLRALAAVAALLLVSCGSARLPLPDVAPYRIEIQQGNFVSQEMVSQLKPGMSKDQVRFVLGTALITDSFHADRWDYVFRRQKANSRELEQRKLAVYFEDGKLKRIEGDVIPAASTDAGELKMPEERPASAAAPLSRPAAQTSSEAPKPAPAADKPTDAPAPSGDGKPQEKGWWERLKDKIKF